MNAERVMAAALDGHFYALRVAAGGQYQVVDYGRGRPRLNEPDFDPSGRAPDDRAAIHYGHGRLSEAELRRARMYLERGLTLREAAASFGVSHTTLHAALLMALNGDGP